MDIRSGAETPFAVESPDPVAPGVVPEPFGIPDLDIRLVDDLETVGPSRHEDLHEHVVEIAARVLGNLQTSRQGWHDLLEATLDDLGGPGMRGRSTQSA
jgi:hypothetical protein